MNAASPPPPALPPPRRRTFLPDSSREEDTFLGTLLRQEAVGGMVVLAAAVVAVLWANSPWSGAYEDLRSYELGPLDLEHWAADGALALFFYLAGLELKREFLVGSLRRPVDAMVPVVAALAGVALPAAIYTVLNSGLVKGGQPQGWAIPAATDIAFALAVLAVVGGALPSQLRAFLLTLAVVDDLIVIVIIAAFYTDTLHVRPLLVTAALLVVFAVLQKVRGESWVVYVPLSVAIWWFMHESGIHATVAGVLMGLLTRVIPDPGEHKSPAERLEHALTPLSTGLAVPFFALMSAGVAIGGTSGDGPAFLADPVVLGILGGLLLGKPVGVLLGSWVTVRLTRAELNPAMTWRDLTGVAVLAGVGFTVALLVTELSFEGAEGDAAKTAVLLGSVLSATLAAVLLRRRSREHARHG